MSRFRPIDRETDFLLPPSVQDWLSESYLARYVVDVVEGRDVLELECVYGDRGSDAYHPAMLLSLLI
jgi:transposase